MLDYQEIVRAAEKLDPVPASVSQLAAVVARDHWGFSDVEQVIMFDQALTGRVLQVANSAASSGFTRVGTVKEAVIRVGVGPVLSFAMAACIGPVFRRALPQYGLSEGQLWRHSVATSLAVEVLLALSPHALPPEAVTAGLLHDVGKLVLARFLGPDLLTGLAEARAQGERSSMQAEIDVLGVHHGELSGLIARHWKLPDRLADAITWHHSPDKAADLVCDAVHLANLSAKVVEGADATSPDMQPSAGALVRLGLTQAAMDRVASHVGRRFDEALARYEVAAAA
jgi:HD-like signal output (HDOD) protein